MSKKDELLAQEVLEKIEAAGQSDLKLMIVDASSEARKIKTALKKDTKVRTMKEDLKLLESGYKDKIKACEMIVDLALARIEFLDEV